MPPCVSTSSWLLCDRMGTFCRTRMERRRGTTTTIQNLWHSNNRRHVKRYSCTWMDHRPGSLSTRLKYFCQLLVLYLSHLMGMFYRTIRMLEHGIKPVYVFDGKPPQLKSAEVSMGSYFLWCVPSNYGVLYTVYSLYDLLFDTSVNTNILKLSLCVNHLFLHTWLYICSHPPF